MFASSTQLQHFIFANEQELNAQRQQHNQEYIQKHSQQMNPEHFLSFEEERLLLKQNEQYLMEFCRRFEPPMPKFVIATALHYFKRFYLHETPMNYHPKELLITCVYLACKVEEFNVSIMQFVANISGDRKKATDIVLSNELLLMSKLRYFLTVHNPFRPVEGFLIDIKSCNALANAERLRPHIEQFLDVIYFTDACLLYPPTQIALAAILHACSQLQQNIDDYILNTLFKSARDKVPSIVMVTRTIRRMYKDYKPPNKEQVKSIEQKLELCRNPENNPDSEIYKEIRRRMFLDDDLDIVPEETSYHIADSSVEFES